MKNLEILLEDKGLLSKVNANDVRATESSWFMVLFQAISGLLTSMLIMFVMLFALYGLFDSFEARIIIGTLFLIISSLILRKNTNDFLENFALAFVLAGEGLLITGLGEWLDLNNTMAVVAIMIIFTVLFFMINAVLHRFVSAFVVLWAGYYLTILYSLAPFYYGMVTIAMVWLWLNEYRNINLLKYKQSLGYACTVFLLYASTGIMHIQIHDLGIVGISSEIVAGIELPDSLYYVVHFIVVGTSISLILQKMDLKFQDKLLWFILAGTFLFVYMEPLFLTLLVPVLVLLLAFYGQNILLYILSILAMILSIFSYYSITYVDFMMKSNDLVIFGAVVLGLALLLHLYLKKQEEVSDA